MGIFIKEMTLPTDCSTCPFNMLASKDLVSVSKRFCWILNRLFMSTIHRLPECPLIEVDEDALMMFVNAFLDREKSDGNIPDPDDI